jgi:hypothetical protein
MEIYIEDVSTRKLTEITEALLYWAVPAPEGG